MVKKISSKEFNEVESSKIAVIDFSATWCGPCKMLAPVLEQVSDELGEVNFFNVDVDDNPDLAVKYGITNIPALLIFKNGDKVAQQVGFQPKTGIIEFVKSQM